MYIVSYTWDSEDDEFQMWQEMRFEDINKAREFATSLMDDGVAIVRVIKV